MYYFILPLRLGNSEAIGKKTVDRVTRIECKHVTDGMICVESLIRLCFVHASLIVPAIGVTVFLTESSLTAKLDNGSGLYPDHQP